MIFNKVKLITLCLLVLLTVSYGIGVYEHQPRNTKKLKDIPENAPFSLNVAFEQLMYSYAAYCDLEEINSWTCPYCITDYNPNPVQIVQTMFHTFSNTFGFIAITGETIVMAFRGTQGISIKNWITDLNFPPTSPFPAFPAAKVHRGFLNAYLNVQNETITGIKNALALCPNCNRFVATGHSLGGALAILAVADVFPTIIDLPIDMYTYGSPRVGDVAFAEYFESTVLQNYWRVVNHHDIVPHLPTKDMGFYHLPIEVWFDGKNDTSYKICDDSGEDPTCSDSVLIALDVAEHLDYLGIEKSEC
ncbi:hypothetical protein PPL_09958 [Heterostelium album PN500]|uniref:Fungal lipase-type domain-containing protein n=1 Tax=Heterostelium pallidum (strain ATCC 26659 / Pp 5 / PN500) TaxID=670386 RepID=D3BPN3_HETP5|nr:hypothetical protein PPL_09958 [Heterostelium album PN500]EFA76653.1 hypothetical protein PPL_09958 [Heterostelium album PN500]|eukprot:XP_020428785.1 hypothetical protein PPL_09958 [Heterostelium album PN500]